MADADVLFRTAKELGYPRDQIEHFLSAGYVPQPKQLEFHAAARLADASGGPDQIGFGGARGPGKSHAGFAQLALDDCRRYPGLKCLYLRKVGKQAKEQFEDLRRALPRQHVGDLEALATRIGRSLDQIWPWAAGSDCFVKRQSRESEAGESIADQYAELGVTLSRANVDRINGAARLLGSGHKSTAVLRVLGHYQVLFQAESQEELLAQMRTVPLDCYHHHRRLLEQAAIPRRFINRLHSEPAVAIQSLTNAYTARRRQLSANTKNPATQLENTS